MGVSPKHLKRFAGGYGRDLQGVELLFEESGGGLVGEIVNAKIDPIGLFRGKPFFFALLFVGFHARKTKSRNPWEIQSNWIPHSVPARRRGRVEKILDRVLQEREEARSRFFTVSKVLMRRLRTLLSHVDGRSRLAASRFQSSGR